MKSTFKHLILSIFKEKNSIEIKNEILSVILALSLEMF